MPYSTNMPSDFKIRITINFELIILSNDKYVLKN